MNASTDIDAEFAVLTTELGARLLEAASTLDAPTPGDLARLAKLAPRELVSAALRLSVARRRAREKFTNASRLWLDSVGVEQATGEVVARHKAARFSSARVVVDLCSGVGGDALAIARLVPVIAVDASSEKLRRLAWNARALGVGDRVLPVKLRAETFAVPESGFVHIDPDRRAREGAERRARSVEDYRPDLAFLERLMLNARAGAIKLGPASDFHRLEGPRAEVEIIGVRGECKEATVWFGELAEVRRRATVLPDGATWTDRDGSPNSTRSPAIGPLSDFILEPDPALVRANLLDRFGNAHDLRGFSPTTDLRTGPAPVDSPFLTSFRVLRVGPLDMKRLRRWVREDELGVLDVKTRRIEARPEAIRRELRLEGRRAASLFLLGAARGERSLAILAERVETSPSDTFGTIDSFGKSDKN